MNAPLELAYVQYCATVLYQCKTIEKPEGTPVAVPETYPREDVGTYPVIESWSKKDVSRLFDGSPEREKTIAY